MNARLQRRVQRYGWDRAAGDYEDGWRVQLAPAQDLLLELAALGPGERVLDVACGTGLVSFRARQAVGPDGFVLGTDLSAQMVATARRRAMAESYCNVAFERADAECLDIDPRSFDAALCALGLMYVPDPQRALEEMRRGLRPGGRAAAAVWGERSRCGWAEIFPITDAHVASEVCSLFFRLGTGDALAASFARAGFENVRSRRIQVELRYPSVDAALSAAFRGGPVALAYHRFDAATRAEVHDAYLQSIEPWRDGAGYRVPGEFVAAIGTRAG